MSSRAPADAGGRACPPPACPLPLVITAVPQPAAAPGSPSPGPVRRRDLPGVRSRPVDEPAPQAGYLPGAAAGTHAPAPAAAGAPCSGPRHAPPTAPPRSQPAAAGPFPSRGPAGVRSATCVLPCSPAGRLPQNQLAAASGILREARTTSPVNAGTRRVKRRPWTGPSGAVRQESRGPPWSACAAGTRASWRGDGCSAGTCACSRETPDTDAALPHSPPPGAPARSRLPRDNLSLFTVRARGTTGQTDGAT